MKYSCFICSNKNFGSTLKYKSFTLYSCKVCKLYKLSPQTNLSSSDYLDNYNFKSYEKHMRPFRLKQFSWDMPTLLSLSKGKNLLDVGCAAGWFLSYAQKNGFNTSGLEPQTNLAKKAKLENPKSKILIGGSNLLKKRKQKYDVITIWNVLEHFSNPEKDLKILKEKLNNEGILAIRTPNSYGVLSVLSVITYKLSGGRIDLLLKGMLQLDMDSKHWFLFSKHNLEIFLKNNGLNIEKSYTSPNLDWEGLEDWFKARKISPPKIVVYFLQVVLVLLEVAEKPFNKQDDLVVFARKSS